MTNKFALYKIIEYSEYIVRNTREIADVKPLSCLLLIQVVRLDWRAIGLKHRRLLLNYLVTSQHIISR